MTTPHATLTGSDLHEPKGIDAASAHTVYIADGAGNGAWTTIGASSLAADGNPFGAQLFWAQHEKGSGIADGGILSGWTTRNINTLKLNQITGASLSANQITLPTGTYIIKALVPYVTDDVTDAFTSRLRNITLGSSPINGTGFYKNDNAATRYTWWSALNGRFGCSGSTVFEIQSNSVRSFSPGAPATLGETEVYTQVMIWKVG